MLAVCNQALITLLLDHHQILHGLTHSSMFTLNVNCLECQFLQASEQTNHIVILFDLVMIFDALN